MKLSFTGVSTMNPRNLMLRAGYAEQINLQGEVSYVRRFGGAFPRFHAYLDSIASGFTVSLHLDQKAPLYRGVSAHNGEYDGPVVAAEGARITALMNAAKRALA
jgi:hypothetical protein